MSSRPCLVIFGSFLAASIPLAHAGDAGSDWQRVEALDAGPSGQPKTPNEARTIAGGHLDQQERELRSFVADHPEDRHAFEARLRLVRLLSIRGSFQNLERSRAEAASILDELGRSAQTPEQHAEVAFTRISNFMRNLREPGKPERDELLASVRKFESDFPADRRLAPLLAETATLFDGEPAAKGDLLASAQRLATDAELKGRIADDLKRLDFLWKEPPLRTVTADGKALDIADFKGRVVVLIFFAAWSPPSMAAVQNVREQMAKLPKPRVQVVGVSLDAKAASLAAAVRDCHLDWPIGFDGKGWESPPVRGLGINSLPTVWILDSKGRLRVLNGIGDIVGPVNEILKEP